MDCSTVSLMEFPDCLLLNLLKYLDSSSLYHLTKVNKRFETLILDSTLWKKIDARGEPNSKEKIDYCLDRVNKQTSVLCLRGEMSTIPLLTEVQMESLPNNLTVLALENQNIDQPIISLNNFPKTLVELSFKNSSIANSSYFFKRTFEQMANLKVLLLDGCTQINSSVVMSVSKYRSLEILSFYKCEIENSIPYFSIAAWHGFKKLKILDVRLSGLGNPFLKSMMRCTNIMAFYFQNMDTSYVLDFKNRQQQVEAEGNRRSAPQVDFAILRTTGNEDNLITDKGTAELKRTSPKTEGSNLPDSFLYTDPYGICTCGYDSSLDSGFEELEEIQDIDSPIEGGMYDLSLERHIDLVDVARKRYDIKEYPVKQDEDHIKGCKRSVGDHTRQKQPLKKRIKPCAEFQNDEPSSSFYSFEHKSRKRSSQNNGAYPFRIKRGCDRPSSSETEGAGASSTTKDKPSGSTSNIEGASCSISPTETVECIDGENSDKSVPLKKRKRSGSKDAKNTKRGENSSRYSCPERHIWWAKLERNTRRYPSSGDGGSCSIRSLSSACSLNERDDTAGCSKDLSRTTKSDNDEPTNKDDHSNDDDDKLDDDLCCCSNSSSEVQDSSKSPSTSSSSSFATSTPTHSSVCRAKCHRCGENFDDRDQPGTSRGNSSNINAPSQNEAQDDAAAPTPCRRRNKEPHHRIGVIFRNRMDNANRNVFQICISDNRVESNLFVPGDVPAAQQADFPVVVNAVRMLNFILPDPQNDNPGGVPEVEVINLNMNKTYHLALKRLSLRGYTGVTDVTLGSIEHLNLQLLDLTYTRVTKAGIQAFLRMNPNCRIVHKAFCVCRPNIHF